jgi:arsenate reductase
MRAANAAQWRFRRDPAMDEPTIYHNPRCSKSRATLDLLVGRGFRPRVVNYLDTPPTATEIGKLLTLLDVEPRDIIRKDEAEYADLKLSNPSLTRKQLITAIAAHPRLLQRPIVVADGKAAISRPPEAVLAILKE